MDAVDPFALAPCPFCGCPEIWAIEYIRGLDGILRHAVRCPACRASGSECLSKTEAIRAWNSMKMPQPPVNPALSGKEKTEQ